MEVQYRDPDVTIASNQTILAKGNAQGILEVIASVGPTPPGSETYDGSANFTNSYVYVGAFALTKLYLSLNSPLTGAGPFYAHITDSAGAPGAGSAGLIPTPKMTSAGDFFYWEPPGGVQFSNGIYIAMSTTPFLYTAAAEPFAVTIWTVP